VQCLTDQTVAAYVDGALELAEVSRVDHHIDSCARCRAQLSTVAAVPHSFTSAIEGSTPGIVQLVQHTIATGRAGDPLPATALGRYVIDEVIGRGGMGVVVRARDPELERFIAIKLVDPAQRLGGWRVHVREEARAMAKLRHPNVVAVYDAGAIGDQLFIAMELVDGTSLATWRARDRDAVIRACIEAGRGVCAAHEVGLIHGDIKPDNILVGGDGRALIGDFGLARATADDRHRGVAGTPGYMAPELALGGAATAASDQFALAVTLYVLVTGARPAADPVARPAQLPRRLWRVVQRGLAADPARRYPTMQAFVTALERASSPRRKLAGAAAAIVVGAGALVFAVGFATPDRSCADPIDRAAAFTPVGCTGPACGELAARGLAWRTTSVGVCEATRAGRQSEALLDRRMRCLDQSLLEHAALARASTEQGARLAVLQIPPPEHCASVDGSVAARTPLDATHAAIARSWIAVANADHALGRFKQAHAALAPKFATIRSFGQGDLIATAAELLGDLDVTLGLLDDAEQTFDIGLRAAAAAGQDAQSARLLLHMAHERGEERQQWDRSAELLRAADAAVARVGNPAELTALLEDTRGMVAEEQGDRATAGAAYARAVATFRVSGPRLRLANALQVECAFEESSEQLAEAKAHCNEAIAIFTAEVGPDHPYVAEAETNLGVAYVLDLDRVKARAIWERALARLDRGHDEDVLGLASVLIDLADVSVDLHDVPAASAYLERVRQVTANAWTDPKSLSLQLRAAGLQCETDVAGCIDTIEGIAKHAEAAFGIANRTTGAAYEALGIAYWHVHRMRDAKAAFARNVEATRAIYGDRNPATLKQEDRYAQALLELGETKEARPLLEHITFALEETAAPDSPSLASAYCNLADCMLQLGDAARAEELAQKGLAIRVKRANDPLQTSEVRFILAKAMWKARKDPRALREAMTARDEMKAIGPSATTLPEVEAFLKQARAR